MFNSSHSSASWNPSVEIYGPPVGPTGMGPTSFSSWIPVLQHYHVPPFSSFRKHYQKIYAFQYYNYYRLQDSLHVFEHDEEVLIQISSKSSFRLLLRAIGSYKYKCKASTVLWLGCKPNKKFSKFEMKKKSSLHPNFVPNCRFLCPTAWCLGHGLTSIHGHCHSCLSIWLTEFWHLKIL